MQLVGTFSRRKSIQKLEPELPKRKVSAYERQNSFKKHRTEHQTINSPQIQLKSYRRKELSTLNQHQTKNLNQEMPKKPQLRIDRTQQSSKLSILQRSALIQTAKKRSVTMQSSTQPSKHKHPINRQQITSRFTINHNETQEESLSHLLSQNKSKQSNPLINTARLREENKVSFEGNVKMKQDAKKDIMNSAIYKDLSQHHGDSYDNMIENNNEERQRQNQTGQNFDDYQFGGWNNSNEIQNDGQEEIQMRKSKKKARLQPPRIPSYQVGQNSRQKPHNWRQQNRYQPQSQQQHRMSQQLLKSAKASLQSHRQQQQLQTLMQQYHQNKNSIRLLSQRKTESNRIIKNIYRQKRAHSERTPAISNSCSLPQLKAPPQPKMVVEVLGAESQGMNVNQNRINITDSHDRLLNVMKKLQNKAKPIASLSSRLGFGTSNPRPTNQEDINESELQSVRNIQKKLRQKGIQFNTTSIRKGLLNITDQPLSKLSKTTLYHDQHLKTIEVPQKQLPSNGFYKIFPL